MFASAVDLQAVSQHLAAAGEVASSVLWTPRRRTTGNASVPGGSWRTWIRAEWLTPAAAAAAGRPDGRRSWHCGTTSVERRRSTAPRRRRWRRPSVSWRWSRRRTGNRGCPGTWCGVRTCEYAANSADSPNSHSAWLRPPEIYRPLQSHSVSPTSSASKAADFTSMKSYYCSLLLSTAINGK